MAIPGYGATFVIRPVDLKGVPRPNPTIEGVAAVDDRGEPVFPRIAVGEVKANGDIDVTVDEGIAAITLIVRANNTEQARLENIFAGVDGKDNRIIVALPDLKVAYRACCECPRRERCGILHWLARR